MLVYVLTDTSGEEASSHIDIVMNFTGLVILNDLDLILYHVYEPLKSVKMY